MELITLASFAISEPGLRLGAFLLIFVVLATVEAVSPWRDSELGRRRWWGNFGILLVDFAALRILLPFSLVVFADSLAQQGYGLLSFLNVSGFLAGLIAFIILDCAIYWQHRLFHTVPWLWRVHRMHHSDTELDVTSAFRFHPIEIVLSVAIKAAIIFLVGPPAIAVLIFEIVLNGTAQFNHANIRLPEKLERMLRYIVVTPDMHLIHHSTKQRETDSNFGFNLPIWDRLFGSYTHAPEGGYAALTVGLNEFRNPIENRIDRLVTQPFRDARPD
jgi:sterol desaturase/sphingolipid hydroxylase (fatty acid hydroxylase superfamily)